MGWIKIVTWESGRLEHGLPSLIFQTTHYGKEVSLDIVAEVREGSGFCRRGRMLDRYCVGFRRVLRFFFFSRFFSIGHAEQLMASHNHSIEVVIIS